MPYLVHTAKTLYGWNDKPALGSLEDALNELEDSGWSLVHTFTKKEAAEVGLPVDVRVFVFHQADAIDFEPLGAGPLDR